ncbi:MAG: hypothetical protein DI536_10515 [Archangium gephyra]|uniref:Gluconokinase n=1 Tax=Archangium gephyra TaxID=48 RepID=A0A2W5TG23_9BACT|nr:MAG: hypothetical protein DI536_10515 [Archangium gephyra]
MRSHPPIVVMGVSGGGKTTVAQLLALRLGWRFTDADALHPPGNVATMAAGLPLDEADRAPWLDALGVWLESAREADVVLAFSALKRAHRARFPGVRWVCLRVPVQVAEARVASRVGHFFPPTLVASQFAALEEPGETEALTLDGTLAPQTLEEAIVRAFQLPRAQSSSKP